MECADSKVSMDNISRNKVSAVEQKKFQNKSKNIGEVYPSEFFRCIMFLSYRITFLCNVFLSNSLYIRKFCTIFFYEKSCKVVIYIITALNQRKARKMRKWQKYFIVSIEELEKSREY